jgi:hypothetical protein
MGEALAEPLLACYARMAVRLGPSGAGQLSKMVNQICVAGLLGSQGASALGPGGRNTYMLAIDTSASSTLPSPFMSRFGS